MEIQVLKPKIITKCCVPSSVAYREVIVERLSDRLSSHLERKQRSRMVWNSYSNLLLLKQNWDKNGQKS